MVLPVGPHSRTRVVPTRGAAQPQSGPPWSDGSRKGQGGAGQSMRNLLQLLDARDMAAFVESDLVQDMTVGELAKQLGINPSRRASRSCSLPTAPV